MTQIKNHILDVLFRELEEEIDLIGLSENDDVILEHKKAIKYMLSLLKGIDKLYYVLELKRIVELENEYRLEMEWLWK